MKKLYSLILILILIGLVTTSCDSRKPLDQDLPDIGTINFGYLPIINYAPVYIGVDKGYFEEEGLHIEMQSFKSSSFMMPILATGDLDIGVGQTGPDLFNAVEQGFDIKLVGPSTVQKEGFATSAIVVRKDLYDSGQITEPSHLAGRTIAINVPQGLVEFYFVILLEKGGLTLEDVEIVTMAFPDMNVALANEAIDVALLPDPLLSTAIQDEYATLFIYPHELFDEPPNSSGILFGKRLLEPENREVGIRFFKAYMKGVRELQTEDGYTDENLEIISKYINVEADIIKNNPRNYIDPNGKLDPSFVERIMMYFLDQGYVDFTEPLEMSQIVDLTFLEEALERIGPYE